MGWLKDTAGSIGSWGWNNLVPNFKKGGQITGFHMGGNPQAYANVIKAKSGCRVTRAKPRKVQKKKKAKK